MGLEYYCSKKYRSAASKCDADVLCEWRSSECETNGHSEYLAEKIAALRVKQIHRFMICPFAFRCLFLPCQREQIKRFVRLTTHVGLLSKEENVKVLFRRCLTSSYYACFSAGKCMWNPIIGSCTTKKDYIAALLTGPGKNSTDALCTYLKINGFSHCHTYFSKRKCERDEACCMMPFNGCEPKEESYLSAAVAEDPRLEREYKRFKKQCSSHTTKKACVEPSKVY